MLKRFAVLVCFLAGCLFASLATGVRAQEQLQEESLLVPSGESADESVTPSSESEVIENPSDAAISDSFAPPANYVLDLDVAYITADDRMVSLQILGISGMPRPVPAGQYLSLILPTGVEQRVTADASGIVRFEANPGVYGIVCIGTPGHAVIPFIVRDRETAAQEELQERREDTGIIKVPVFGISPSRVARAAQKFLPPTTKFTLDDLNDELISDGQVVKLTHYRAVLGPNGRMEGQVFTLMSRDNGSRSLLSGTNILIHRNGMPISRAISDRFGRFYVEGLQPGTDYGLIAAGPSGYAAFAFEAVAGGGESSNQDFARSGMSMQTRSGETFVALMMQPPTSAVLPVVPVPAPMVPVETLMTAGGLDDPSQPDDFPPPGGGGIGGGGNMAGGGAGSGGGFGGGAGGGAGGGMGGIGGLLGLAGLGAAIAASSGDDEINFPPLATDGGTE